MSRFTVRVVRLIFCREADLLVFCDELLDLESFRGLTDLVPHLVDRDVFVCGPEAWAEAVCAAARRSAFRTTACIEKGSRGEAPRDA